MSEVNKVLHGIAKGAGIVFLGTIISMFFGFLSVVIIARYFSTAEYGIYNMAWTILNIAMVIAMLGFPNSLPREIAYYKEKEPLKIGCLISTALTIILLVSLSVTAFLIFGSIYIAQIFNEEMLIYTLKIMSLALPFLALTGTFVAISQGFGRVREKVYFQNILYPILWFSFLGLVVIMKLNFYYIFVSYVIAQVITFFALAIDVFKKRLFKIDIIDLELGKELIKLSIPLMFTGIAGFIMTWTDTLMLGFYKTSEAVGLYNAAASLAKLLPIVLYSAGFIYPPLATALYAQGKINKLKRVYQVLTKWMFLATLPLFILMFLFPEATLGFFFGEKYLEASSILQILALGFMFHTLLGLNGLSLIVIKESNFVMYSTLISAVINVFLNVLLIQSYGIKGAAIATAISYFTTNVLNSLRLYQKAKVHPFSRNYIKVVVISLIMSGFVWILHFKMLNILYASLVLIAFLIVYLLLLLLSKSIDKEDIDLLLAIERKIGINLSILKKVLQRFI
ncbi:flippase [Methanocaldococcus sp. 28A]